mmetsp:Transcript_30721/g.79782  ORF Transcript_30721/g.79782 Transcript_30721/m.79782 type:complete len:200 (-) Transcript_30721:323-922(-)
MRCSHACRTPSGQLWWSLAVRSPPVGRAEGVGHSCSCARLDTLWQQVVRSCGSRWLVVSNFPRRARRLLLAPGRQSLRHQCPRRARRFLLVPLPRSQRQLPPGQQRRRWSVCQLASQPRQQWQLLLRHWRCSQLGSKKMSHLRCCQNGPRLWPSDPGSFQMSTKYEVLCRCQAKDREVSAGSLAQRERGDSKSPFMLTM